MIKKSLQLTMLGLMFMTTNIHASGVMSEEELKNVERADIADTLAKQQISKVAGLLAEYEIEAGKLIN
ncbi:MAG: hypothetical protein COC04_03110, partial [Gammaproteobacteria bacterium]